jgi:glucose-1-phosphate adenylyltransferase
MILAGGQGTGLGVLTRHRPASSMPFGGKYRIIDFCLSNCSNSEISRVAVLTQYAPGSLNDHIGTGATWDLDRREGGVKLLQAYGRRGGSTWYAGTADAIVQNLNVIENWAARWVVIASGDQVYKMDYAALLNAHRESGCPVTLTVKSVPQWDCRRFGIVTLDGDGRVTEVEEKPDVPTGTLANLGIYVFDSRLLFQRLGPGCDARDLVQDLIRPMIADGLPVNSHRFTGYWDDIGTVDAYFRANMELLAGQPRLILADPDWRIYTPSEERPPVKLAHGAEVRRSKVANGAIVRGRVIDSILFPGVIVEPEATVTSSIVFQDTVIGRGSEVDLAIVDKRVSVGEGAVIGHGGPGVGGAAGRAPGSGDDLAMALRTDEIRPELESSIVVVGKGSAIPGGQRIGRGCVIDVGVDAEDFASDDLPACARVDARRVDHEVGPRVVRTG